MEGLGFGVGWWGRGGGRKVFQDEFTVRKRRQKFLNLHSGFGARKDEEEETSRDILITLRSGSLCSFSTTVDLRYANK